MSATAVSYNERPLAPVYYAPQAAYTPNAGPGYFPAPYHPYHEQKPSLLTSAFHVLKGVVTAPIDIVKGVIEHPESLILIAGLGALSVICPPVGVGLAVLGAGGAIIGGVDSTIKSVEAAERGDTAASNYYAEEVGKNIFNGALSFIGLKGAVGAAKGALGKMGAAEDSIGMGELLGFKKFTYRDPITGGETNARIFKASLDMVKDKWANVAKEAKFIKPAEYDTKIVDNEPYSFYKSSTEDTVKQASAASQRAADEAAAVKTQIDAKRIDLKKAQEAKNYRQSELAAQELKALETKYNGLNRTKTEQELYGQYQAKMVNVYDAADAKSPSAFNANRQDANWAQTRYNANQFQNYVGDKLGGYRQRLDAWNTNNNGIFDKVEATAKYARNNWQPITGAYASSMGLPQFAESLSEMGNDEHPFYQTYGFYGPQVHAYG